MRFIKDYMRDDVLRHELNALTQETFGFDFESWVTNGYFEGDYIPYSYEENGRIIANVSVNLMKFVQNGKEKYYIQLGTVMTSMEYRNKGYARDLMKMVLNDYVGKCDGIYLFGNISALDFYNKIGFLIGMQYRYILKNEAKNIMQAKASELDSEDCFRDIDTTDLIQKSMYMNAVRNSGINSALEQTNKYGLQMFYTSGMENVYYSRELDCYVVMEVDNNTLYLKSVFCIRKIDLEQVISHIKDEYDKLILSFAPCKEEVDLFDSQIYDGEEDYRFFYYGDELKSIEKEKLYFPDFSHA